MKHVGYVIACIVAFSLGTLVPVRDTHAQTDAPNNTTYYSISFNKSKPGQDWRKMEHDLWKPIEQERINSGHLNSWTVMEPVFAGPHPYDYITVESSNNLDDITKADYEKVFTKVWGEKNIESRMTQTYATRDQIGDELWVVDDGVSKPSK
jgi:hypothetical protein